MSAFFREGKGGYRLTPKLDLKLARTLLNNLADYDNQHCKRVLCIGGTPGTANVKVRLASPCLPDQSTVAFLLCHCPPATKCHAKKVGNGYMAPISTLGNITRAYQGLCHGLMM